MDASAALRPLDEAADAVRRLNEYESSAELSSAIETVRAAVERSLRLFLRSDPGAPENHRMSALSPETFSVEEVVQSLRSRDRLSIDLAGTIHELRAAAERAAGGEARAADADVAERAASELRRELQALRPPASEPVQEAEPEAVDDREFEVHSGSGRWMAWVASGLAVVFLLGLGWVFTRGGNQDYDDAVQAFRSGRLDSAAAGFERVVQDRPGDVSARLYLGRIYRRQQRFDEAVDILRQAVGAAPEDADVRRELGYLFMDLQQPESAVRQFERALELDPEEMRNWAGLIRALRVRGDPRAEELLRDAPDELKALLAAPTDTVQGT